MNESDAEVIARVLAGDRQSFDELVVRHQRRLRSVLSYHCASAEEVEEHVQEAFVLAYRHLGDFAAGEDCFAWLKTIALNSLRMEWRRRRTATRHGDAYLQHLQQQRLEADPQGEVAEARAAALRICLERLSPGQRQVLAGRYGEARPVAELAEREGISLAAIKVRLLRLREVLRACIEKRLQDPGTQPS